MKPAASFPNVVRVWATPGGMLWAEESRGEDELHPRTCPGRAANPGQIPPGRGAESTNLSSFIPVKISSNNGSFLKTPQSKNKVYSEIPFSAERKPCSDLGGLELFPRGLLRCCRVQSDHSGTPGQHPESSTKIWAPGRGRSGSTARAQLRGTVCRS